MGFGQAIGTCFRKYVTFSGRAARAEFWWFVLLWAIVSAAALLADTLLASRREGKRTFYRLNRAGAPCNAGQPRGAR